MSILAIVGVIVSSTAMFIVLSGFSGLKNYSLEFISSVSPELKIYPKKGKAFELTDEISAFLEQENIRYGLSFEDKALFSIKGSSRVIRLRGLDEGFPKKNIDSIIYQGRWFDKAADEIVVGLGAAYDLGISSLDVMNPAVIYVPRPGKSQIFSEKDIMRSRRVISSGVFSINEELNSSLVFCDLDLAQDLFGLEDRFVGSIDIYSKGVSAEKMISFFGPNFNVKNQVEQNETIYKMLNTEQVAIYLIFSLIVVVALFNMFGALIMMGIEKRENLRTLVVLGGTENQIGKIFFFQGLLISFVGCIVGLLVGVVLVVLQQNFSLFMITPALAYPVVLGINNILFVFCVVVLLGVLASVSVSYYVKKSILQISLK